LSPPSPRGRKRSERSDREQALGAVLSELTSGRPWASGISLGRLGGRWVEVVGERLARETSPAGLNSGVLMVRASSAAWGAQIRFLAREVRDKANDVLGQAAIKEVKVTVARDWPVG
jgi:predicted nucleic acid-binding Zn ribbon protein